MARRWLACVGSALHAVSRSLAMSASNWCRITIQIALELIYFQTPIPRVAKQIAIICTHMPAIMVGTGQESRGPCTQSARLAASMPFPSPGNELPATANTVNDHI